MQNIFHRSICYFFLGINFEESFLKDNPDSTEILSLGRIFRNATREKKQLSPVENKYKKRNKKKRRDSFARARELR